jgi:hypothetical protein
LTIASLQLTWVLSGSISLLVLEESLGFTNLEDFTLNLTTLSDRDIWHEVKDIDGSPSTLAIKVSWVW